MKIIVHVFWWPNVFISLGFISKNIVSMSKGELMFTVVDNAKQSSNLVMTFCLIVGSI